MITLKVNKMNFDSMMFPLKYKNALIFSNKFGEESGLYGIEENSLFFISKENLDTEFEIEVPENMEELAEYTKVIEFAVQKIAINKGSSISAIKDATQKDKLRPFIDFMIDYEKGLHIIEGIKNGII